MTKWSLPQLLYSVHDDIQQRLKMARTSLGHPVSKGDASEAIWLKLFQDYFPQRYQAEKAHIVDSRGDFSDQIDVVVFDRQYSPFIFQYEGEIVVPAESVYAVFEAKQTTDASLVSYVRSKVQSVRCLYRTSLPIPYAKGVYPPKPLIPIYGGFLAFESKWTPPLGKSLLKALGDGSGNDRLDFGCIAAHGYFSFEQANSRYDI